MPQRAPIGQTGTALDKDWFGQALARSKCLPRHLATHFACQLVACPAVKGDLPTAATCPRNQCLSIAREGHLTPGQEQSTMIAPCRASGDDAPNFSVSFGVIQSMMSGVASLRKFLKLEPKNRSWRKGLWAQACRPCATQCHNWDSSPAAIRFPDALRRA
jgi:hypothetical protein